MSSVLVVDDDDRIRTLLVRALTSGGYAVTEVSDGRQALEAIEADRPDLVLLDLVMPHVNGLQVLSRVHERAPGTRVIVMSAIQETSTRIKALELGAVDVVAKPFSTSELLARVRRNIGTRAVDTRGPRAADTSTRYLAAGSLVLDTQRRRARDGEREITLSDREFALLNHLMTRVGEVCRREELLHDVWGMDFDPGSNVVEVNIARLRQRLGNREQIETVRNVGYCFLPA